MENDILDSLEDIG